MENSKLVSIGVPTFNGEVCVRRALDSLLAQTHKNIEIIVSDDASTDNTFQICESYAKKFPQIRCVRQKTRGGCINNLYAVLREARGEYFMWAGQDDRLHLECVNTLVSALEARPPYYSLAVSSFQRVYEDGVVEKEIFLKGDLDFTSKSYYRVYKTLLTLREKLLAHQVVYSLFRRELLSKYLRRPMPEQKIWDTIFVSEMALATRFVSVNRILRFSSNKKLSGQVLGDGENVFAEGFLILNPPNAPWFKGAKFFRSTYTNIFFTSLARVFRSPIIPIHRKLFAIFPWLAALWVCRRRLLQSLLLDFKRALRHI